MGPLENQMGIIWEKWHYPNTLIKLVKISADLSLTQFFNGKTRFFQKKMPKLIDLTTFTDKRGNLTVVEKVIPFDIKRLYYIYGVDSSERGFHRHKKTVQAAICLTGSCKISTNDSIKKEEFILDSPAKCLLLLPEDWHIMNEFTQNAMLMILASEFYDYNDYIFEPY